MTALGFYEIYTYSLTSPALFDQIRLPETDKRRDVIRLKKVDAILSPATPTTAFRHGEKIGDPLQMYLSDIYTVNANVAGIPGLVVPFSKDSKNLPIGVQLLGNHFEEEKLLQIGSMIEKIR